MKSIFKTFFLSLCVIANTMFAYAQTASILPPAKTTFVDQNGKPLTKGTVDFYIPSTSTRKTTWQDAAETIPNTNPVVLDSAGRALILGSGNYRQVVKDQNGNLIWDQVTSSTGSGGGSTPTATGDGDLVGTIKPWAGMSPPNQYLFTYGQEVSRTTYAALFTAITSTQAVFCTSGSFVISGLSDTTNFWIGSSVETPCTVAATHSTTITAKTSTTITVADVSNITANSTITVFPWGNGNKSTTFNLPDFRGFAIAGNNNMGGTPSSILTTTYFGNTNPNSTGAPGGNQSVVLTTPNLPAYTPTIPLAGFANLNLLAPIQGNISSTGGSGSGSPTPKLAGGNNAIAPTSLSLNDWTGTGAVGSPQGGTSTPFSLIQPTKTSNYIIKVLPDANSATANGVTDINGMIGSIGCGGGLICTGNTITVNVGVTSIGGLTGAIACGSGITCVGSTISTSSNSVYVLPSDYGAVCDGITNDAVALQNMITASAGKTIYIPPGTCVTNSTLTLPSNTTIIGAGRDSSVLTGNALPLLTATNKTNIVLHNFWLKGTDNVTSWAISVIGALSLDQDAAAVASQTYTITGMKFSNFNSSYWVRMTSTATGFFQLYDITISDNIIVTSNADIPTDGVATNNVNYGFLIGSSSGGHGQITNLQIKNNRIESTGMCLPITVFGNSYKTQITENLIIDAGVTSPTHCLSGDLVTILSYGINIYDSVGDGNPPTNFLIASNSIINPYGTGMYIVGDGTVGHTAAVYNSSGSLIANNLVDGQVAQTDATLPRGCIVVALITDTDIIGNKCRNSFGGFVASGQMTGEVRIASNTCKGAINAGASTPYCIRIDAGSNGSSNTNKIVIKDNFLEQTGLASSVFRASSATGSRWYDVDISNNTISATISGLLFQNQWVTDVAIIANNKFIGAAGAGAMFSAASLTGNLSLQGNVFTTVAGAPTVATLPTAINGSSIYISDGAPGSGPCTGTSTGSTAFRQNNAWKCF